jgi:hypothetical protein
MTDQHGTDAAGNTGVDTYLMVGCILTAFQIALWLIMGLHGLACLALCFDESATDLAGAAQSFELARYSGRSPGALSYICCTAWALCPLMLLLISTSAAASPAACAACCLVPAVVH